MNKKKWDKLPADIQSILTVSVRDFAEDITTQLRIADQAAVKAAQADPNITIHDWSEEERKSSVLLLVTQWKEFAKGSDNAQKSIRFCHNLPRRKWSSISVKNTY